MSTELLLTTGAIISPIMHYLRTKVCMETLLSNEPYIQEFTYIWPWQCRNFTCFRTRMTQECLFILPEHIHTCTHARTHCAEIKKYCQSISWIKGWPDFFFKSPCFDNLWHFIQTFISMLYSGKSLLRHPSLQQLKLLENTNPNSCELWVKWHYTVQKNELIQKNTVYAVTQWWNFTYSP